MAPPTNEENKDRLWEVYFRTGLHYYIVARYATVARFGSVSGNLVHHAIELFLKGALIDELDHKDRNLGTTYQSFGGGIKHKETIQP
jgi:hypothetical protein